MTVKLPATPYRPIARIDHGKRSRTKGVLVHTIEGSVAGAISWFNNPEAGGVGAHVVIGLRESVQLTDLNTKCWHGVGANSDYIGFEHEGFARFAKAAWLSSKNRRLLRMSANRTAWVCWKYKLGAPSKGRNVLGHADFPKGGHTDPGAGWPWVFYMWLCRRAYKNLVATGGRRWTSA